MAKRINAGIYEVRPGVEVRALYYTDRRGQPIRVNGWLVLINDEPDRDDFATKRDALAYAEKLPLTNTLDKSHETDRL